MIFFKLAVFCNTSFCWKDGKVRYNSVSDAIAAANSPGKYRVSRVDGKKRTDLTPFVVG